MLPKPLNTLELANIENEAKPSPKNESTQDLDGDRMQQKFMQRTEMKIFKRGDGDYGTLSYDKLIE